MHENSSPGACKARINKQVKDFQRVINVGHNEEAAHGQGKDPYGGHHGVVLN